MLGEARLRVSVGDTIVGAQGTRENHVKDGAAPGRDQGCPYGRRGGPRVPWTCGSVGCQLSAYVLTGFYYTWRRCTALMGVVDK